MKKLALASLLATCFISVNANTSEEIGSVNTEFKLIGPDHKIKVEVFEDPKVQGVACYVSRAVTGGIAGGLGLATDTSDASIACRKVGKIVSTAPMNASGEVVFQESRSPMFKHMKVVRMVDARRNVFIYLVYSDKLIDGSPKNSITAIAIDY
jgi:CreA protein